MKPIATTIGDCIEQAYTAELNNLTQAQGSGVFKKDMLGLMYHYIGFQIDFERNTRFLRIMAMCLSNNMTLQERDDFYADFNVSQSIISALNEYINDGWPEPIIAASQPAIDLEPLRNRLIAKVNFEAGKMRSKFITVAPGKEMVYIGKWMEARDFFDDPEPDINDYPLLSIDIGKTYNGQLIETLEAAALLIHSMYLQWKTLAKPIEEASSAAITTIKNPEIIDENALIAAAEINWPNVVPALFPAPTPPSDPEPQPE